MSKPKWDYEFSRRAARDMRRLDRQTRERIFRAIDDLASANKSVDVRRLTGREETRLRVGDWRVLFVRDQRTRLISIIRVLPRDRAYDR